MKSLLVKKIILKNALPIFYCHTPDLCAFEISMHINTGSRDETESNNGISHFLEHMMFRGSQKHSDSISLARALESFGGETNAMTGVETTTYWLKGDAEKTPEAIECFADFFLHPNFADIDVERSVVLQEIASDHNESGESIDTESLGMFTLFPQHSIGLPIIGTEAVIKKLSKQDLLEKRKHFYTPQNCALTIHTSLAENETIKALQTHFGQPWDHVSLSPQQRISIVNSDLQSFKDPKKSFNALCLQNNSDNQFALKLMFPIAGGYSREVIVSNFLQRILDDGICTRLPATIREKYGLVYDISCDAQYYHDIGTFSIDALVSEDLLQKLLEKLAVELKSLVTVKPSEAEIDHIRFRYLFDIKQIQENPSRYLNREVTTFFIHDEISLDDEMAIIKSITADELLTAAQQIFLSNKRSFVLVGPKARKKRDLVEKFLTSCFVN